MDDYSLCDPVNYQFTQALGEIWVNFSKKNKETQCHFIYVPSTFHFIKDVENLIFKKYSKEQIIARVYRVQRTLKCEFILDRNRKECGNAFVVPINFSCSRDFIRCLSGLSTQKVYIRNPVW